MNDELKKIKVVHYRLFKMNQKNQENSEYNFKIKLVFTVSINKRN